MAALPSIALSGMHAAQMQLQTSAHNMANVATPGFTRQETRLSANPEGGVQTSIKSASGSGDAMLTDVVSQLQAKNAFLANLAVFKTHDKMAGALFNQNA